MLSPSFAVSALRPLPLSPRRSFIVCCDYSAREVPVSKNSRNPPLFSKPVVADVIADVAIPDPACPKTTNPDTTTSFGTLLSPTLVLTTHHSVHFAEKITVTIEKEFVEGYVVKTSPVADLALLQLSKPLNGYNTNGLYITFFTSLYRRHCAVVTSNRNETLVEELELRVQKPYTPADQTIPFMTSLSPVAVSKGHSGSPIIDSQNCIVGISRAIDPRNHILAVPSALVLRFLAASFDEEVTFGVLPVRYQNVDKRLARYLGMEQVNSSGVYVARLFGSGLRKGDAITAIDGHKLTNNGFVEGWKDASMSEVELVKGLKETINVVTDEEGQAAVPLEYYCARRPAQSSVELEVLREGSFHSVSVVLQKLTNGLDRPPTSNFAEIRGHIFVPLTVTLLKEYGDDWESTAPTRLVAIANGILGNTTNPVVLSAVMSDEDEEESMDELDYHRVMDAVVVSVNGIPVEGIESLNNLDKHIDEAIVIEFDTGYILVL